MNDSLKLGGLLAVSLLGATAVGVAILLARDPELLKRLVKQGALTYHKAATILAEAREELGDVMAEALHQAEEELRQAESQAAPTGAAPDQRAGSAD
jgi:hypothetical protein